MSTVRNPREDEQHTVLFVGEVPVTAGEISDVFDTDSTAVTVIEDGQRAIRWLSSVTGSTGNEQYPDTIFLTAGLTAPCWPTLLHAIKSSPRLWAVPVIVLTDDETDADTASVLEGNAHVTVSESSSGYTDCLETLGEFWTEWTQTPCQHLSGYHE